MMLALCRRPSLTCVLVPVQVPRDKGGPGRLVGDTLTAVDFPPPAGAEAGCTQGLLLYGGR